MVHYPTRTLLFLSLDNGQTLETHIQDAPLRLAIEAPSGFRRLAILAHPLGRLGGSLGDPVVRNLFERLVSLGYRTIAFNSRGVGQSSASPSWTGAAECQDFQLLLRHSLDALSSYRIDQQHEETEVLVVGYSAGALYASTLQPQRALPQGWKGGKLRFRLVLISYPLDVMWALSVFCSTTYTIALETMLSGSAPSTHAAQAPQHSDGDDDDTISSSSLLVLYGDQDQFTKVSSYDAWVARLRHVAAEAKSVDAVKFQGADHLWRSAELLQSIADTLERWLRGGATRPERV